MECRKSISGQAPTRSGPACCGKDRHKQRYQVTVVTLVLSSEAIKYTKVMALLRTKPLSQYEEITYENVLWCLHLMRGRWPRRRQGHLFLLI